MRKGEKFQRLTITEQAYNALKKAEKKIDSAKVYKRIQALKLIHKNWNYGEVSNFLSVSKNTISTWVNIYRTSGLTSFLTLHYKGGQPKLKDSQLSKIKDKASKGSFTFAKEIRNYINEEFKINYGLRHVQLLSKKNFNYPLKEQD